MAAAAIPTLRLLRLPIVPHRRISPSTGIRSSLFRGWRASSRRRRGGDDDLVKAAEDLRDAAVLFGSVLPKDLMRLAFPSLERLQALMVLIDGGVRLLGLPSKKRKRRRMWGVNWKWLKGAFVKIVGAIVVLCVMIWKVKLI